MVKLRAFTEQVDAKGRELHNRDPERSSLSWMDPDIQCGVRRREPEDLSPRCKSRRASSSSPATLSAPTQIPWMSRRLYPTGACMVGESPIDLQLPKLADKDFIPATVQSMWVATQEYPASPPSLASQSVCLDLDTISSGDSDLSNSGAPCVNPVVVVDQEFTIISVHSSDTDPDSSDEGCLSDSQSEPVSPIQTNVSGQVVSPSHYPAPDEPVELSAISSVLISPNWV